VWWIYYRVDGKRYDETTGQGDERVARSVLAQRRREIREGTWKPPAEREALTVSAYAERWLEGRRAAGVRVVRDEETRLRSWVLPLIGGKALDKVTRSDVRDVMAHAQQTPNPKTGKLYTLKDLNVFKMSDPKVGTGMLEDNLFVRGDWISDPANQATAVKFLKASFEGWIYCRDHMTQCVNFVLKNGSLLGRGHQTWQMNEINKLIWPAADGVGYIQPAAWDRTAQLAQETKNLEGTTVLTKAPDAEAYTNDIVTAAYEILKGLGVDINGSGYAPIDVTLTEGGV